MTTDERRRSIARILIDAGQVQVGDLAARFGVSCETVRKDLIALERQGLAKKRHGGATAPGMQNGQNMVQSSAEASLCIVEKALEYIPEQGRILLGSGALCLLLAQRIPASDARVFVTDSLDIACLCAERALPVLLLGGELLTQSRSVSGLWATDCLSKLSVDRAFLASGGFAGRNGPCTDSFSQALVAHAMVACAKWTCVLAEGASMKNPALMEYATWEEVALLITDSGIDMESLETLQERVEVQLAY